MQTKDVIVIGSSAGGVEALRRLCAGLPADLPAAVLVVQHLSPSARSVLPQLLARVGPLPAATPEGRRDPREGADLCRRARSPPPAATGPHADASRSLREPHPAGGQRPVSLGGDRLWRQVIGVVLTGLLDDGTDGLIAIKAVGGTSVVQDPEDAEWPSMPRNALKRDHVDHAVKLDEMGALLSRLCREEAGPSIPAPEDYMVEDRIAAQDFASIERGGRDARAGQQDLVSRLRRGAQPDRRGQGDPVPLPGRPRLHAAGPGGRSPTNWSGRWAWRFAPTATGCACSSR
jgi:two-component system chemotaxis response regulator CheB